jgi:hypothetical protein
MKVNINSLLLIVGAGLLCLCGCAQSPISGKSVTSSQLQAEWDKYKQKETAEASRIKDDMQHVKDMTDLRINEIHEKKNTIAQLVDQMGNIGGSGSAGAGILAAVVGAVGLGVHVNNLRQDRKIALPEKGPGGSPISKTKLKPERVPLGTTPTTPDSHAAGAKQAADQAVGMSDT